MAEIRVQYDGYQRIFTFLDKGAACHFEDGEVYQVSVGSEVAPVVETNDSQAEVTV